MRKAPRILYDQALRSHNKGHQIRVGMFMAMCHTIVSPAEWGVGGSAGSLI